MCSGIYSAFHMAYSSDNGFQKSRGKTDTSELHDIAARTFEFGQLEMNVFQILPFTSALLLAYKEMSQKGQLIFLEPK